MKSKWIFLLLVSLIEPVSAKLRVVATTPDLADLSRRIGGTNVEVDSLAKGTEDIHAIPQRPSFIPKLNRADAVVLIGLEAEHAFLPALLEVSQNSKIIPGASGYIDCSVHITPMDVPTNLSRSEGELHPRGNPHYAIDPRNGAAIAEAIRDGFIRLDPSNAGAYRENTNRFLQEWNPKLKAWNQRIAKLNGIKVVSHHQDMVYLCDYLRLKLIGTIELKPGVAPTPTHITQLLQTMKDQHVQIILREVQYSDKTARWLSEQTGAKMATVATMGGAFTDSQTFEGMIEHNIQAIIDALPERAPS